MLSKWLGNPTPWHGHYYALLALPLVAVSQLALLRYARFDTTAGISLCTVAVGAFLVKLHASVATAVNVSLLFLWGVRVLVKGIPTPREYVMPPSTCELAFNKTLWVWLMATPTVFAVCVDKHEIAEGWSVLLGVCLCVSTLILDFLEKSTSDGSGTYTRNPYAFSAVSISWGLWTIHPVWATFFCPNLFSCLVLFAPGGTAWVEARRRTRDLRDSAVHEYRRTTSPFFPMPPGVYEQVPRAVKRLMCFDF